MRLLFPQPQHEVPPARREQSASLAQALSALMRTSIGWQVPDSQAA
jgi:hypothetical protein